MTAPDFSPAEARRLAVIEVTQDAPEALRERVAVALYLADNDGYDPWLPVWADAGEWTQDRFRRMADRAIRVVTEDARR